MWCTDTSGLLHMCKKHVHDQEYYEVINCCNETGDIQQTSPHSPSPLRLLPLSFCSPSHPPCLSSQCLCKLQTCMEAGPQSWSSGDCNGRHVFHLHPAPLQCQLCHPRQVFLVKFCCYFGNNAPRPVGEGCAMAYAVRRRRQRSYIYMTYARCTLICE